MISLGSAEEMPHTQCANCGHNFDFASMIGKDGVPTPGSVAVCIACGYVMIFDEDLGLRKPTKRERTKIEKLPNVKLLQQLIRMKQQ